MKKNTAWPEAKIKKLAGTSGKPLEVNAAQAFLSAGWTARLGTHFDERNSVKGPRELDVLAEREEAFPNSLDPRPMTVRIRALVSCKGFRRDQSPLMYSASTPAPRTPHLLSNHRYGDYGPVPDLERGGAAKLLQDLSLDRSRPVVAIDVIQRQFRAPKGKKGKKVPARYVRSRQGDSHVFEGIDSAMKAAFYWRVVDLYDGRPFAAFNVPICILSLPFWDVPIDGGEVGKPEVRQRGYQVLSYPSAYTGGNTVTEDPLVLVMHRDELTTTVRALDTLFTLLRDAVRHRGWLLKD